MLRRRRYKERRGDAPVLRGSRQLSRCVVAAPGARTCSNGSGALHRRRGDGPGAAIALPAQWPSVGMGRCLVERVGEHVIEEAQQATQRL
jgi:hypothetical protein